MTMSCLNIKMPIFISSFFMLIIISVSSAFSNQIVDFKNKEFIIVRDSLLEISPKTLQTNNLKNWRFDNTSWTATKPFEAKFLVKFNSLKTVFFEWSDNKLENIEIEVRDSKGELYSVYKYNDSLGFSSLLGVKNQVFLFTPHKIGEVYTVKYKTFSHNVSYPLCWIITAERFSSRFNAENSWYGLLAGIILMVLLLNIFMYVNTKENVFLFYAFYALCFGLFQCAYTGLGFQWIWSESYSWNRISNLVCSFLLVSSQFLYLYYYVKSIQSLKPVYIYFIIGLRFILLILSIYIPSFSLWYPLFDAVTIGYQLWLMIKSNLYKSLHGSLYLVSITVLEIAYLVFISAYFQLIKTDFITYNSIALGGIVELMIGMFAIALRYRNLILQKQNLQKQEILVLKQNVELKEQLFQETQEKQRIQVEINRELEIKVQERTVELAQKNQELEELYKRWEQISSTLDKENWHLNRQLESDRLKLMWGKGVDFESFQKIFISEEHVLKFVAEIKWTDQFQCKKCSHQQYVKGAQYMSRKCTKCKYEESATAGTIFHGVRFSLVKALYISLQTVLFRDTFTIKQLSEEISLREATLWSFRKKIMTELEIISKKYPKGNMLNLLILGGKDIS